jgi:hypothetical protein
MTKHDADIQNTLDLLANIIESYEAGRGIKGASREEIDMQMSLHVANVNEILYRVTHLFGLPSPAFMNNNPEEFAKIVDLLRTEVFESNNSVNNTMAEIPPGFNSHHAYRMSVIYNWPPAWRGIALTMNVLRVLFISVTTFKLGQMSDCDLKQFDMTKPPFDAWNYLVKQYGDVINAV